MSPARLRVLVLATLVLCAGIVSAVVRTSSLPMKGAPAGPTREELLVVPSERATRARAAADASERIAHARGRLASGDLEGAGATLNQVLHDLRSERGPAKLFAAAAALLGEVYAAATPDHPEKSLRYHEQAALRLGRRQPVEARLENEGANTCDAALPVGSVPPDYVESGMTLAEGDEDWRSFTLESPRSIVVETIGDPLLCDTNLILYGGCAGGAPTLGIYFNEDRTPSDYTSRIPNDGGALCLEPGTYYVDLGSFLYLGTQAPFELRIRDLGPCTPPVPDAYEPDDELALAHSIRVRRERGHDHDASGSTSRRSALQHHSIYPRDDIDFVHFTLSRPETIRIHTGSPDARADTFLAVGYRASGVVVGLNDDEAPGMKGSAFSACMPAGDYFAAALSTFSPFVFDYDFDVQSLGRCDFEEEPNDGLAGATTIRIRRGSGTIHGVHTNLPGVEDVDYYRFRVPARRGVVVETGGYDAFDVDSSLELYDAAGNLLASDDDGGTGFLARIERVLPAGTYYAKVAQSPFELPLGDTWFYNLSVTLAAPPLVEQEPNDACLEAQSVALGARLLGSIGPPGDVDRYLLPLPASAQGGIMVSLQTSSVGDTVLKLYDDPGACLAETGCDDDSAPGLDSLIHCCLPAHASYVVAVSLFDEGATLQSYAIEFRSEGECVPDGACPIAPGQLGCP